MRRLFVSDLHLTDADGIHFLALARLLENTRAEEIYLLGDLCEVWVGDDDDGPLARHFVELLAATSRRARVFVMRGNRDFLYGAAFERAAGVTLIPDPYPLDHRVVLAHGDAFCIDDRAYQDARQLFRSPGWQADVLARPLAERRALASHLREQSLAANANKADNIMDVSPDEVARVMREHNAALLIHGHTHRPGIHRAAWGRRVVLGAWERCGWVLEQNHENFDLRCFALGCL